MRPYLAAVALSAVLLSTPSLAADARLPGLPSQLLSGAAATGTEHELPKAPVTAVQAGSTSVVLEETTLDDVKAKFGGDWLHAGEGDQSVYWLCYAVPIAGEPSQLWFVSDGTVGGSDHAVTMVAANFGAAQPTGCPSPAGDLKNIDLGVPGLGASKDDLKTAFVTPIAAQRDGLVAYTNQSEPTEDGFTTFQALNYLLKDGKVAGVAVSQITSN